MAEAALADALRRLAQRPPAAMWMLTVPPLARAPSAPAETALADAVRHPWRLACLAVELAAVAVVFLGQTTTRGVCSGGVSPPRWRGADLQAGTESGLTLPRQLHLGVFEQMLEVYL